MPDLDLTALNTAAAKRIQPFLEDLLGSNPDIIHSVHITGSALTADFDEQISDVNSIVVLKSMDLKFLKVLAPLGKKYGRQKVAAPLIMTPEYIRSSLDVFPIEFLNFSLIHATATGEDILADLEISNQDLRHQCERETKTKLISLRQGYLSTQGDRKLLTEGFITSITGYIPLFRGIIRLFEGDPPLLQRDVVTALSRVTGLNTDVFSRVLQEKHRKSRLSTEELNTLFEDYYASTESLGKVVDEHSL